MPCKPGRLNKLDTRRRVYFIYQCLLAGMNRIIDIRNKAGEAYAAAKKEDKHIYDFKVGDRTIEKYMTEARRWIKERAEVDEDKEYARMRDRYNELYKTCKDKDERSLCVRILKQEAELLGLEKPRRIQLSDPNGDPLGVGAGTALAKAFKATDDRLRKDDNLRKQLESQLNDDNNSEKKQSLAKVAKGGKA